MIKLSSSNVLPSSQRRNRAATFTAFFLALCALAFSGCSPSEPKPSDAAQAAKVRIAEESQGRIIVVEFKPTSEKPMSLGGRFRWDYEAELEFGEDCKWLYDRGTETTHVSFRTASLTSNTPEQPAGELVKKGDRRGVRGGIFLEPEKGGWSPFSITITHNTRKE